MRYPIVAAISALTALAGAGPCRAADAALGADVVSSHVWRGLTISRGPVVQPHLAVSGVKLIGRPLTVRMFANYEVGNENPGPATSNLTEIDLETELDLSWGFSAAYSELSYPGQILRRGFDSTRELTLAWRGQGLIDGLLALHYDVGEIDDYFIEAALGRTFAVSEKSGLAIRALAGHAGRPFAERYGGHRGGFYQYDLSVRVDYRATERLGLTATVAYTGTFREALPQQAVGFYGGVGATVRY